MKNLSDKAKKRLIVAGGIAISAALLLMIGSRFVKEPDTGSEVPVQSTEISGVVVEEPGTANTAEKEEVAATPIEVTEVPQSDSGAVDTGTEQTIQADIPEKPTYTEEQLTDPTQTPSGEKVEIPTVKEETTPTATSTPRKTETTSEQSTSGGLPGFNSVPDGGSNQVIDGESDGDINKQVGTMN